ncbi:MAG: hypothetical protein J6K18_04765 [Bacilli bacterium]|nr:hypothetical protein [Bacilli bacterium]
MKRVYVQVKRIINNIDFNKIIDNFEKCSFLIKKNNYLYGLDDKYLTDKKDFIIIDNKFYIIYEAKETDTIKDIVIGTILKMYENQRKEIDLSDKILKILTLSKNNDYYINKYQQNLLISRILKKDKTIINECCSLINLRETDQIVQIEKQIESEIGKKKYLEYKLLERFKYDEYMLKLRDIFECLEDPTKLFEYPCYVEKFSIAYLLATNIIKDYKYKSCNVEVLKPLFSFEKLIMENDKKIKKLLMYKMINAKRILFTGKVIKFNLTKVKVSENLYFFPDEITIIYDKKIINKKGDFILKLSNEFEIEEGYECFSIDKILA